MSLTIDGFAVLAAIGATRRQFGVIDTDVANFATKLVEKPLFAKSSTLDGLRAISAAVGHEVLALILESAGDKKLKPLVKKLDKHHQSSASSDPVVLRRHILDLARGQSPADPPPPPARAIRRPRSTAPSRRSRNTTVPLDTEAMRAKPVRAGGR